MRRGYSGRSDAYVKSEQGEQGFWPSYADMMSAVALILFFLMLLSYTQNMITGNTLRATQETLLNTELTLSTTQDDLEKSQLSLAESQNRLAQMLQQVSSAEAELSRITISLDDAKALLALQQSSLDEQDLKLAEQAALIASQEDYVRQASEELITMRDQMHSIAFLRLSIVNQVRDTLAQSMGDASKVSVSDNGSLVLSDGVFFDVNSFEIRQEARPTLDKLIDVFASALADENNLRYIDSIVISGHTDWDGTNWDNRLLSTNRANAVLNYMLSGEGGALQPYAEYFSAAGYGEERPIPGTDQNTPEGRAANRRIEISIILKDESILDVVNNYLAIDLPEGVTATVTVDGQTG